VRRPARTAVTLFPRAIRRPHSKQPRSCGVPAFDGQRSEFFYLESFIDELAHAAGKDPYEYRRELIARNSKFRDRDDWLKALDMVAEMSGWGKPLPEGWARGIAVDDRRRAAPGRTATALCAEVVIVSIPAGPPGDSTRARPLPTDVGGYP